MNRRNITDLGIAVSVFGIFISFVLAFVLHNGYLFIVSMMFIVLGNVFEFLSRVKCHCGRKRRIRAFRHCPQCGTYHR